MMIGNRLKELRESKQLSQGDIEKRTGLLRCYISRVENGHTVPAIETLEKMARALEVPMYRLFHDGEVGASIRKLTPAKDDEWGSRGNDRMRTARNEIISNCSCTVMGCCCTLTRADARSACWKPILIPLELAECLPLEPSFVFCL